VTRPPAGPPPPPQAQAQPADPPPPPASAPPASAPPASAPPGRRVRVVLAGQPRLGHPEPARREIEEQTGVGDVLLGGLIRAQLGLAVRLGLLVGGMFGALPLLFALAPSLGRFRLLGLELPWLLLGVLSYPLLVGAAVVYVRLAERNEQDFADLVNRS
jgi:hypothetical protein